MKLTCAIILLAVTFIGFGIEIARHGERKTGEHHAGIGFIAMIIALLLYYGAGVFDVLFK